MSGRHVQMHEYMHNSIHCQQSCSVLQVIVAGTSKQVSEALEEAEEFREPLVDRGVLVVPLPIFEDSNAEKDKQNQLNDTDLRYAPGMLQSWWHASCSGHL